MKTTWSYVVVVAATGCSATVEQPAPREQTLWMNVDSDTPVQMVFDHRAAATPDRDTEAIHIYGEDAMGAVLNVGVVAEVGSYGIDHDTPATVYLYHPAWMGYYSEISGRAAAGQITIESIERDWVTGGFDVELGTDFPMTPSTGRFELELVEAQVSED